MNIRLCFALLLLASFASCTTDAPRPLQEAQARKDPAFTEFFRRKTGWTAGDGALSIPLSDDRVLWLFGDSHVDDFDARTRTIPCLFQARNAGLLQGAPEVRGQKPEISKQPQSDRTLVRKGPGSRSWLARADAIDEWFWPLSGFQNGEVVYIYLSALTRSGVGGMWDFRSTGHDYWAKVKFPEMEPIEYSTLPSFHGITFGNGFVTEDDYTYAFGGRQKGDASDVYVARFRSANPESEWSFWDEEHWNSNVTNASAIARGASTSIHVCKVRNKFLLTTSALSVACDQGKEIYMSTSSHPIGPFSPRKKVFTIDDCYRGHYPFFYFPIAHPEFINSQDELLVTYSINGYEPCVSSCVKGRAIPDHYRPKAIRVPLELIGIK